MGLVLWPEWVDGMGGCDRAFLPREEVVLTDSTPTTHDHNHNHRARALEGEVWGLQAAAGVDFVGVGDFALYGACVSVCVLGCVLCVMMSCGCGMWDWMGLINPP